MFKLFKIGNFNKDANEPATNSELVKRSNKHKQTCIKNRKKRKKK